MSYCVLQLKRVMTLVLVFAAAAGLLCTGTLQAADPLDPDIAAAITGGQNYLKLKFRECSNYTSVAGCNTDSANRGYWPYTVGAGDTVYSGYELSATSAAVATLIDTGKASDPVYKALIDKGIAYIKSFVNADGGIYQSHHTYDTGLALVALSLYGKAFPQDNDYKAIVHNAA